MFAGLEDGTSLRTTQAKVDDERIALPILRIGGIGSLRIRDYELVHHLRRRFRSVAPWPMWVRQVAAAGCYCQQPAQQHRFCST